MNLSMVRSQRRTALGRNSKPQTLSRQVLSRPMRKDGTL
jgi:hypothetical protein